MNSKKNKNKNRSNKPPNLNPPQKNEDTSVSEEDVRSEDKNESAQKVEERVPEIISEVVSLPVVDIEEKDEDTPKKPKRNRGKKKNQDKNELVSQDEKPVESEETKHESVNLQPEKQEKLSDVSDMTPTARKKKNKNKKTIEPEGLEETLMKKDEIMAVDKDNKPKVQMTLEHEVKENVITPTTDESTYDQETKSSKKKNKKKKHRTDSERSDKPEELSCVTAFQNLLKHEKSESKIETSETIAPGSEVDTSEKVTCDIVKEIVIEEKTIITECTKDQPKEIHADFTKQPSYESGNKGKKKNKKDKKNPPKEEDFAEKEKLTDVASEAELEAPTNIIKEDFLHISDPLENLIPDVNTTTEETFKSAAKIAKPVEKKRKGKRDERTDSTFDNVMKDTNELLMKDKPQEIETDIREAVIEEIKSEQLKDDKTSKEGMPELKETCQTGKSREVKKTAATTTDPESIQILDSIPPPVSEISKKRKKSPKPTKSVQPVKSQIETSKEKSEDLNKEQDQLPKTPIDEKVALCGIEVKQKEEKPEKVFEHTLQTETVIKEQDNGPERKTTKKEKKTPKLPSDNKAEITESVAEETSKVLKTEDIVTGNPMSTEDKTEIFYDLPLIDDIEICSWKADESEGSTCGITPDIIQYPRATSQGLIDDNNNNMMIQDITFVQETKLQIPVEIPDTPLIHKSGKKPLDTPDVGIIGDIVTSIIIDEPTEPKKTELKSKMIEVNQNMEDLRLSIEKSLAELTSIEKSEEEVEKDFANKILHITEDLPTTSQQTELKLSMPSEIFAKSLFEKEDASLPTNKKTKESTFDENKPLLISELVEQPAFQERQDVEVETDVVNILPSDNISESAVEALKQTEIHIDPTSPPICPARKDHKNKGKSKKKGKQDTALPAAQTESLSSAATASEPADKKETKKEENPKQKSETSQGKGKQQSNVMADDNQNQSDQDSSKTPTEFDPIENFEDAMTSSADDINRTFEIIANEASQIIEASHVNPEINIIAPIEDTKRERRDNKVNPVSQPKNLLGHPDIPVPSNRIDYKKEKNKTPNDTLAKVKIKDSIEVDSKKESKESQTDNIRKFMKNKSSDESFSLVNENDDFVYKYSFRKVFLQSACHVCKKELKQTRFPCGYCSLVFYCSGKHKDEDWPQHQALCFAVSTIGHLKDQKHIYADSKNVTGQNYRLLRMQMIVSCEKVLKRRLVPWEQEALLYPRLCADVTCREWRQSKLTDCDGCGQISFCAEHPEHFPKSHQRWCKSYSLYQKLVSYQQTKGRLEPRLPSKVMDYYQIPEKMNEVLASMYEEKIDMSDIQYAALTQIATAPLTAAYCYQTTSKEIVQANGTPKKTTCTIHVVGAELQFEADALNKWEVFYLHLTSVDEVSVAMVAADLNPGNLPLELLSKVKLCEHCRLRNRRVNFSFQDKKSYHDYWAGEDYITPNIVCAFNANIDRSSMYNSRDPWPKTINCILKQRVPFLITAHTLNEIHRDLARIKECAEYSYDVIIHPKNNNFASVRPDRNFISDDEMPLLFKNYCFALLCGN